MKKILRYLLWVAILWLPAGQAAASANLQPAVAAGPAFLAIPAASFIPAADGMVYENHGRYIKYKGIEETGRFLAAVPLPQGATLLNIKACFYDDSADLSGSLTFTRSTAGLFGNPAGVESQGSSGFQELTALPSYPLVTNNSDSQYFLSLSLPISAGAGSDVWGCGAIVEYLPPEADEGVLSVPAAAFRPFEDGYDYHNSGGSLFHYHKPGGSLDNGIYLAPVNLPDGAILSEISLHIWDQTSDLNKQVTIRLEKSDRAGNYSDMTVLECEGAVTCSKSIGGTINNTLYDYWILLELPAPSSGMLYASGVSIDYSPRSYTPRTAVSLSNTAFTPYYSNDDYENHARWLVHKGGINGVHVAGVHLPQGATVTALKACFYDGSSTKAGRAYLARTRLGVNQEMASVSSTGSGGYVFPADASVRYGKIDNSRYAYFAWWVLPDSAPPPGSVVVSCGMEIDFSYPAYLPVVKSP